MIYDHSRASSEDAFDTAVRECCKERARLCIMSSENLATLEDKHVACCISVTSLFILFRNKKVAIVPGQQRLITLCLYLPSSAAFSPIHYLSHLQFVFFLLLVLLHHDSSSPFILLLLHFISFTPLQSPSANPYILMFFLFLLISFFFTISSFHILPHLFSS